MLTTPLAQAATIRILPGETVGGDWNVHEHSDQWCFVLAGRGRITVGGEVQELSPGDLLVIEKGEWHELVCLDDEPFDTLNFYAPPEF